MARNRPIGVLGGKMDDITGRALPEDVT